MLYSFLIWHHMWGGSCVTSLTEISLWLLLGGVVATILAWLAVRVLLRQSIPNRKGEVVLDGLEHPVTIKRDQFGVPTIEAQTLKDLLFGQGFVQAQDRLWQMELNRRLGAGRLGEVFGPQAVAADTFLRRLGLRRSAQIDLEAMHEHERECLTAFCQGVNAAMERLKVLPVEFRMLKYRPEPWQPLDTLTWVQVMSMDLCSNWEQELLRGRIVNRLGAEGASLLHLFTESASLTLPPGVKGPETLDGLWELYEEAKAFLPNGGLPGGSNAWVIDGSRSVSGRPMLANDPHLVGRVPSIWYESKLVCPEFEVQGASFPGVPFVVIGANQTVAWGITNSYADTMDLYLEKLNGEQCLTLDGWQPLEHHIERIEVKGENCREVRVESSAHGPVLFRKGEYGLALRWKNFEASHPICTLYNFNRSGTAAEFKEALRGWQAPSSNFVFADTGGNIGYLLAGHIPLRRKGSGLTPVPGWNGEYEWEGQISFEELPQLDNPECGYLVTANNPVVGSDYPHHVTWDWMSSARAQRIEELILSEEKHDLDTFRIMQSDTQSSMGLRFVQVCRNLKFERRSAVAGRDILIAWDGDGHSMSGEMALYQVTLLSMAKKVLDSALGEELSRQFLGQSNNPVSVMAGHTGRYTAWLMQLLESSEKYGRLQEIAQEVPSRESLVEESLAEAYILLCKAFGKDHRLWEWGKLHRLQFKHPLAVNMLLGWLLNSPAGSAGGDTDTVFQTAFHPQKPYGAEAWCPSFRQVVDLTDEPGYKSVLPTGQSGHPGSRHYLDQFHLWCAGQLRPEQDKMRWEMTLKPRVG